MTVSEMKTNAFVHGEWEATVNGKTLRCAYYADRWPRWEWRSGGVRIDEADAELLLEKAA